MGKGHGLGFSQYQADCLAKEGGKMEDLLNYFFQGIKVERMI